MELILINNKAAARFFLLPYFSTVNKPIASAYGGAKVREELLKLLENCKELQFSDDLKFNEAQEYG